MSGDRPSSRAKTKNDRIHHTNRFHTKVTTPLRSSNADLSVLRKSIPISVTGIKQAVRLIERGTEEVTNLLLNECDIIYECRVCRNMFRSLANFISHKRVYCREKFNISLATHNTFLRNTFMNEDITELFEEERKLPDKSKAEQHATAINRNCFDKKDLSSIVETLTQKQYEEKQTNVLDYYNEVNYRIAQKDINNKEHAIRLDHIQDSNTAVYQTVVQTDGVDTNNDFMIDEIMELQEMLSQEAPVLNPNGQLLSKHPLGGNKLKTVFSNSSDEEDQYVCKICELEFKTRKSLFYHLKIRHSPSTLIYPCPSCTETFPTPGYVYRHLCKEHRNTMITVRKLREQVQSKAFRADEIPKRYNKKNKPKSDNCKSEQQMQDEENQLWMETYEFNSALRCTSCGRKFERRAALSSHQLFCKIKSSVQNKEIIDNKNIHDTDDSHDCRQGRKNKPVKRIRLNEFNEVENATKMEMAVLETVENIDKVHNSTEPIIEQASELVMTAECKNSPDDNSSNKEQIAGSEQIADSEQNTINELDSKIEMSVASSSNETVASNEEITESMQISNEETTGVTNERKSRKRKTTTKLILNDETESVYWNLSDDGTLKMNKSDADEMQGNETNTATFSTKKMLLHINEEKMQCLLCNRIFPTLTNAKRHVALHMKLKRFQCGLCSLQFYNKSECVYHLGRTHNMMGERHFVDALVVPLALVDINIEAPVADDALPIPEIKVNKMKKDGKEVRKYNMERNNIDVAIDNVVARFSVRPESPDDVIVTTEQDPLAMNDVIQISDNEETDPPPKEETVETIELKSPEQETLKDVSSDHEHMSDSEDICRNEIMQSKDFFITDTIITDDALVINETLVDATVTRSSDVVTTDAVTTVIKKRGRPRNPSNTTDGIKNGNDRDPMPFVKKRGRPKGSVNKGKKTVFTTTKKHTVLYNSNASRTTVTSEDKQHKKQGEESEIMRKMVLEVIFGGENSAQSSSTIQDSETEPRKSLIEEKVTYIKPVKRHSVCDDVQVNDSQSSRPVRNKVKPKNNDFEYDLSDLLKREAVAYKESQFVQPYGKHSKRPRLSAAPVKQKVSMYEYYDDTESEEEEYITEHIDLCNNSDKSSDSSSSSQDYSDAKCSDFEDPVPVSEPNISSMKEESQLSAYHSYMTNFGSFKVEDIDGMTRAPLLSLESHDDVTVVNVSIQSMSDDSCSDEIENTTLQNTLEKASSVKENEYLSIRQVSCDESDNTVMQSPQKDKQVILNSFHPVLPSDDDAILTYGNNSQGQPSVSKIFVKKTEGEYKSMLLSNCPLPYELPLMEGEVSINLLDAFKDKNNKDAEDILQQKNYKRDENFPVIFQNDSTASDRSSESYESDN